jgi:YHS domain-containing protein
LGNLVATAGEYAVNELIEAGKAQPVASAVDPVCGMTVDPARAAHRAEHAGRSWFFCSAGCRSKFLADPARFADAAKPAVLWAPSSRAAVARCRVRTGRRRRGRHDLHLPDAS